MFAAAEARTLATAAEQPRPGTTRERDGRLPDIYIAMGQTAENVATLRGISRAEQDEFGVRSQNLAEKAIANGVFDAEIAPVTLPDGTVVTPTTGRGPAPRSPPVSALRAGLPRRRHGHRRQLLPAQRRRRRRGDHERHPGRRARTHSAGPDRGHRGQRPQPEIMGLGPVEASRRALARAGMTIDDMDLVEINEAFAVQVIASARDLRIDPDRLTSTAARSRSATRSASPGPGS